MKFDQSRRQFFKQLTLMGISISGLAGCLKPKKEVVKEVQAEEKSTVLIARHPDVADAAGRFRQEKIQKMLDASVARITGATSVPAAWRRLFKPNDTIGIKVNCLRSAGRKLSSHIELVNCIVNGLVSAGVPEHHIIIWDRENGELRNAGYTINMSDKNVKCYGTDAEGVGYSSELIVSGSVASNVSKILSTHCTAIINVPVLKDHNIAGVSISMKNFFGAINNPNKYHSKHGNPYIADLNAFPLIKEKTRLIICDALTSSYHKGPGYSSYTWDYNGLLVSFDPVALDLTGAVIIEEKRRELGMPSLAEANRAPDYIATAAERGLGTNAPDKIELIQISL